MQWQRPQFLRCGRQFIPHDLAGAHHPEAVVFQCQCYGPRLEQDVQAIQQGPGLQEQDHREVLAQHRPTFAAIEYGEGCKWPQSHVHGHQHAEKIDPTRNTRVGMGVPDEEDECEREQRDGDAAQRMYRGGLQAGAEIEAGHDACMGSCR